MIDPEVYKQLLNEESGFQLRHAVERLREGLFDPVAVRLLTAHEERLNKTIDHGFHALESGKSPHLCVCGAYGQGKSHSLAYIQDRALKEGFVSSMVNLDLREIPLHNMRQVYRELMANLRFPDTNASLTTRWKNWSEDWIKKQDNPSNGVSELLPEEMPHLFRAVMAAVSQSNLSLSKKERQLKKHARYRPREFHYLLAKSLAGDVVPIPQLRQALKYRQVGFYRDASLVCRGAEPYLKMIQSLALVFRQMGYRGWTILFDEGESIAQVSVSARSKSYEFLHQMFYSERPNQAIYPVFAFTDDFFQVVQDEDFERVRVRKEEEIRTFDKDYAKAWESLTMYRLQDLSAGEWEELSERLILLYAKAHNWDFPKERTHRELNERLEGSKGQETRFRWKALVDQLDLIHQEEIW